MNICIDAHDITYTGGAERFVASLSNILVSRGHNISLFTYSPQGATQHFALNQNIRIIHYFFTGDASSIPDLRKRICSCKPDVFLSPAFANNHLLWLAALQDTGIPFVFSERANAFEIIAKLWNRQEREAVLAAADRIHLLLPAFLPTVPDAYRNKTCVIHNAVNVTTERRSPQKKHTILGMARLESYKQFGLLIHAFALLADDFPQWNLEIWGIGQEAPKLQRLIVKHNLEGRAKLCGLALQPQEQYAKADIFCLPSRTEGFPQVLAEAMGAGLPLVAFEGCIACKSLIRHGETGFLASAMTAQSLADTMRPLMADAAMRQRLGENARQESQKYLPGKIYDQWEQLLIEAARSKGHTALQACLNGEYDTDPELAEHVGLLRTLLKRKNVLLENNQWVRRFIRKYEWLSNLAKCIKQTVKRIQFVNK